MTPPVNAQMSDLTAPGISEQPYHRDAATTTRIDVLGRPQSAAARRVVELLRRHAVPFRWRNIDEDPAAYAITEPHSRGSGSFAVVVGDRILVEPDEACVRDELGLPIESPAAAFRAFAAGATDTIIVGRGHDPGIVVAAHDSSDGAVCTAVHQGQVWVAVGANRLLALHRLVTRVRAGDTGFGADRGHGPAAPGLDQLQAEAGVFAASVAR